MLEIAREQIVKLRSILTQSSSSVKMIKNFLIYIIQSYDLS